MNRGSFGTIQRLILPTRLNNHVLWNMAPTSDIAYEFIGRALCGMEVF